MGRKASVKFIIMRDKNDFFTGFKFLDKIISQLEDSHEFEIPIDKFKGTNNLLCSEIELLNGENTKRKFLINIYLCRNIFHLYLSRLGSTFELIIFDEPDFMDIRKQNIGYEFDNNGNKHRIRISLINYNKLYIEIGNFSFMPTTYCPNSDKLSNDYNSFQLSVYSKKRIICKTNELFNPSIDINKFYLKNINNINESYNKLMEIINMKKFDIDNLKKIAKKQILINKEFNQLELHKSKCELEQAFNNEKYIDFIYRILVHKLVIFKVFQDCNDLKQVIDNFEQFKNSLVSDVDLKIYEKIFGLIQYNYIYRKYDCSNTSYIKVKDAENNSIIYQSIQFFKKFISSLDEESPVFMKLLEINSKYGYYNGSPVYNLSLLNVEDVKDHINELVPEIIYLFDKDTSTKAFVFSMTGTLAINKKYLFQNNKEMNLLKIYTKNDKQDAENIAMIIARYFMHEECGHSKFRNMSGIKTGIKSPVKCVSEGKIKELTYLSNEKESDDLIKIFPMNKKGKGDSGHYLETSFGKFKGRFCINYFDMLKNVGKLLKFPEYFVKKEKLPILQENLYLKCIIEKNNIEFEEFRDNELSLAQENYLMHKLIKNTPKKNIIEECKLNNTNSTKEIDKKEDNNSSITLEENEFENSYTEENVLKDINSHDMEEKEKENNLTTYLSKKRNLKLESVKKVNYNSKKISISKEKIKELMNEIKEKIANNSNDFDYDMSELDDFKVEITYENYEDLEDDEACI